MEREIFEVSEEEIDDFTDDSGKWEINGELYECITTIPNNNCDGQGTYVIVKRKSDEKYFRFHWMLTFSQNYRYNPRWEQVFPKTITTYE